VNDDILQDQLEDYIIKTVTNLRYMTLKCIFGPVLRPYVILYDFEEKKNFTFCDSEINCANVYNVLYAQQ
jgi:hypothetical protein